jgi:hypothetical protein
LPPPGFGGGMNDSTSAHSSSVRSLIAQMITIVFRAVLVRPHRRPPLESGPHP